MPVGIPLRVTITLAIGLLWPVGLWALAHITEPLLDGLDRLNVAFALFAMVSSVANPLLVWWFLAGPRFCDRKQRPRWMLVLVMALVVSGIAIYPAFLNLIVQALGGASNDVLIAISVGGSGMLFFGTFWLFLRPRRRDVPRCRACSYDMSGTPGQTCPECGREARSQRELITMPRPVWFGRLAVLAACLGLAAATGVFERILGW